MLCPTKYVYNRINSYKIATSNVDQPHRMHVMSKEAYSTSDDKVIAGSI
jgi:hypothetical protein